MLLKISQYSEKFTYVGGWFDKVAVLQLSREDWEIFISNFFYKTTPVAASEKIINFQENIRVANLEAQRVMFLINTTE